MTASHPQSIMKLAQSVIETELDAIAALKQRVDENFVTACQLILDCKGRIVVLGMGKSGHIGNKIAATMASTGTPAFFVHPGEASHGDLGMLVSGDVVLALSNSGETEELLTILPVIRRQGIPMIAMTGNPASTLATEADVSLDVSVAKEACPLNLAPTASTTATLVMGDALAVALLESRGFTAEDFARSHPGGRLGKRLLVHVRDIMHSGHEMPTVLQHTPLKDALVEMSVKGLGMTMVIDESGRAVGIFTDGDLRRVLDRKMDLHDCTIDSVMTTQFKSVPPDMLAAEALSLMEHNKINALPVTENNCLCGVFNMHDLLRSGVV
ncbi:MAG: KpsF/GutQ family sugar-phosphate isomerase [Gammaproteobacteria bacterium]|nr:MAG: KpsF/GutQ family sugar-phosphate isomerase [Gammaproteobacteria bacterium]